MLSTVQNSIPANSTNLLNRIGSSVADSKILRLAKSLLTKIGEFFSTCMKFCKERFNAFKEKVSPSHQQHEKRHVRQEYLDDDDNYAIELQELPLLSNSNASSAPLCLALVPFAGNSSDASSASQSQASVPENEKKSSKPLHPQLTAPHLGVVPRDFVLRFFPKVASNGSDASSATQSLALVPCFDLKKHILSSFIEESREKRTNLQSLSHAGVAFALLRGMRPRAGQFPFLKSSSLQNPIQALQFPIQAPQFPSDAKPYRG
jgi:hypothetical protein